MTDIYNNIYNNINSFDELCETGCDFILDKIKQHPFLIIDQTRDNLYELVGPYKWIKDYLYQYNKMGFYTVMSQPGADYPIKIYQNYLEYKKSFDNNIMPLNGFYGVKQRAEVEGFMKLDKALKLFELLKDEPDIQIGLSLLISPDKYLNNFNEKSIDKYATISYQIDENNELRFMELEVESNKIIRKNLQGVNRNYKLEQLKHVVKRYFVVRNYLIKKHIPNLKDNDIVGISIMDLEWNRNDYLWEKIFISLKNI